MADFDRESMIEMFIFEMSQLIESLEQTVVQSETGYNAEQINEIFRVMHTIKGSAAMMMYDNIEKMAHSVEDLFYYLREESPVNVDYPTLSDHVLEGADFIKAELGKIQNGITPDGNATELIALIKKFLNNLKNPAAADAAPAPATQEPVPKSAANNAETDMHTKKDESTSGISADVKKYRAKITFAKGCEMENIRAYTLIHNFTDYADHIVHEPSDVIDENSIEIIRNNGFIIEFTTIFPYKVIYDHLMQTVYLQDLELAEIGAQTDRSEPIGQAETQKKVETLEPESKQENANDAEHKPEIKTAPVSSADDASKDKKAAVAAAHVISVNVGKLDNLLNLMGELVIAEAMVTQNSELDGLQLDSFQKETRQLRKIIANLRDTVMSMRMVPLSSTFFKMHRIVRDMCRQLNKDVDLKIIGEENEVDKNTVEHIADPIMHIIRNSVDHGIEKPDERLKNGKPEKGTVILEAKNAGGDVLITIKDDGAGLNREKILKKAMENGLLTKAENEYTDKEIYQFIFLPGFSTNKEVTAFSGRGVGMDVVMTNLEVVRGSVLVESMPGEGSIFTLKIPLSLAIIDGMTILMAGAKYTIPIQHIKKSFKMDENVTLFSDPDGNEMITMRGDVFNVLRLHEFFGINDCVTDINEGTLIQLVNGDQIICLLVDELLGQQQVVVKSMPKYFNKVRGLSGCTLLGNGEISLIVDVPGLFDN